METRTFGNTGMEVSVLGFGGAWIGDPGVEDRRVAELLNLALDSGLNVLDTAPVYGESEEKIGRTMRGRRDEFLLFSKCGEAAGLEGEDWTADVIRRNVERTLRRLGTDRLDLLTIHTCDLATLAAGEATEAVLRAKAEGKTRFVAYSGDNEALEYAVDCGAFDAVMASVNVADQANLAALRRAAAKGLGVVAKRPIANAAWMGEPGAREYGRAYWERLQTLEYRELDLATALGWTLAQPVHVAIVGMTGAAQWRQNLDALGRGPLSAEREQEIQSRWTERAEPDWVGLT